MRKARKAHIPEYLRERVTQQGRRRCGYCLTQQRVVGTPMEIDHIIPEALGGKTEEENLCLACKLCNGYKGDEITAVDPLTGEVVALFDPRHQRWNEHFAWTPEGDQITGLTSIGRATVKALKLNRDSLVESRQLWVEAGWHPPKD
jgi:hypothetical protein